MLIDERVTRRSFLKGLITAAAGAGLNSFIPLPLQTLDPSSLSREIRPYWLEVLSRGARYFPGNIVSRFSDWSGDQLREAAHYSLILTLARNRETLAGSRLPGEREMDEAVERNKAVQYLYESLRRTHEKGKPEEEDDGRDDDPYYARVLHDLSSFMIRHIVKEADDQSFGGFSPFDITLLHSCLTYVRESIGLNEDAYVLCGEDLRETLKGNIGSCYNNLGLALSYLGDVQQAQAAFMKALEHRPDNGAILRNLHDMDSNGLIIHRRLYSRTLVD
jgi:tetratricopeptide (TPR) repeat protein